MVKNIRSWQQFSKYVRKKNLQLISSLKGKQPLIFITGCQRSGTTSLTHIFFELSEVADYRTNIDSELAGALILSGFKEFDFTNKRGCFQTTYLNERYNEYYKFIGKFKMVFLLRNPYSVIYSMVYNWKPKFALRNFALNELFCSCGQIQLTSIEKYLYNFLGSYGFLPLKKACYSYVGKLFQLTDLKEKLGSNILVIDYDDLINQKNKFLPLVFDHFDISYNSESLDMIHAHSLSKASRLSSRQKKIINYLCSDIYTHMRSYAHNDI